MRTVIVAAVERHLDDAMSDMALTLVRQVEDDFGIRLTSLLPATGGEDADAVVYRASRQDCGDVALKVTRRSNTAGLLVAEHLATLGVAGVPAPARSATGRPVSVRDGWQVSVVPWVDGDRAVDVGMTAAQWRAFGELLAAVHATSVPANLRQHLPREDHRTPAVRTADAVAARVDAWPLGGDEAGIDDEIASATRHVWSGVASELREVVRMPTVLGERLSALPRHDVLCHGDAHAVNVVLGTDGTVWLLDWDGAVLAPRERDLMFVLGGVIPSALAGDREQAWFFEGYGLARPADIDPVRLAYYRCSWAVQDVADFASRALDPDRPVGERKHLLALLRSVLSPGGIVEQALTSLRDLGGNR